MPFLQFATGTTANSTAQLQWKVYKSTPADKKQYLHMWITFNPKNPDDNITLKLETYTDTYQYTAQLRFLEGTGWQIYKADGTWGTLSGSPTSYSYTVYLPVVLELIPLDKYVKLTAGGRSWDLSSYTIRRVTLPLVPSQICSIALNNASTLSCSMNLYQFEWLEET
jgi:hypothetical protein